MKLYNKIQQKLQRQTKQVLNMEMICPLMIIMLMFQHEIQRVSKEENIIYKIVIQKIKIITNFRSPDNYYHPT